MRALPYRKEEIYRKLRWKRERRAKTKRDEQYFVRSGIIITIEETAGVVDAIVRELGAHL